MSAALRPASVLPLALRWRPALAAPGLQFYRFPTSPLIRAYSLPVPASGDRYEENKRLYHSFRRGIYMFPCDEVSIAR